ncbi:tetratricopeptide repeat protein [Streptomyces sp. NPDC003077]|uniref:tetratricopeptide repeat protein n=1 Tax=Streptomyces sp. NPDC003077 TaxID=3154443 RepID=UPI00339FFE9F
MTGQGSPAGQQVRAEGGFAYGAIGADIHVYAGGPPVYLLVNWSPAPDADPRWLRELPSRMLSARHEIVPFTGRAGDLADLHAWRTSERRLAVRWLHGPGGQGKSRLAAAFAGEAAAEGWKVVRAVHGPGAVLPPPGSQDLRTDGAAGLLLVVDYADQWPLLHLTWLLSNQLLARRGLPTRVLMLARGTDLWPAVRACLVEAQAATSAHVLEPLSGGDAGGGERADMFRAARDSFAARHELTSATGIGPPMPLDGDDFGLTLGIHMAALVAVDAHRYGRRPPTDAAGLATYLLDRERRHWTLLYEHGTAPGPAAAGATYTTPPEVMNRTVFAAALTGPVARPTGRAVIARVMGTAHQADQVQRVTGTAHPAHPVARATETARPAHPDDRVTGTARPADPGERVTGPVARPTSHDAIARVTGTARPARPDERFTATARPAPPDEQITGTTRPAHPVEQTLDDHATCYPPADPDRPTVLEPLVPDRLAEDFLALTLPGHAADYPSAPWAPRALSTLLPRTADARVTDWTPRAMTLLAASAQRWPHLRHQHLYPLLQRAPWLAVAAGGGALGALVALDDITPDLLEAVEGWLPRHESPDLDPARAALLLRLVPHWLATTDDPARHAHAHNKLAGALTGAARYEEAHAATERAVALYEELAARDPGTHAADLAVVLNNLCAGFDRLRRGEEAAQAGRRAVDIERRLARADPDGHRAPLALALSTHAGALRRNGQWVEGLRAQAEALEAYLRLSRERPGAYDRELATTLLNLGVDLAAALQEPAALAATHGAVLLLEKRAGVDPPGREGTLALALSNLARLLVPRGPVSRVRPEAYERALAASTRAVEIDRRCAKANPDALEAALERSLRVHARVLEAGGHPCAARAARDEADTLLARQPRASRPHDLSDVAETAYDRSDACAALDEARLAVYRYMARVDVRTYGASLLAHLPGSSSGRDHLSVLEEITDVRRRLAARNLPEHGPAYAFALGQFGLALWSAGRRPQAIEMLRRSAEAHRDLVAVNPRRHREGLVRALRTLATFLRAAGHSGEARATRRAARRHRWPFLRS